MQSKQKKFHSSLLLDWRGVPWRAAFSVEVSHNLRSDSFGYAFLSQRVKRANIITQRSYDYVVQKCL